MECLEWEGEPTPLEATNLKVLLRGKFLEAKSSLKCKKKIKHKIKTKSLIANGINPGETTIVHILVRNEKPLATEAPITTGPSKCGCSIL